MLNHLSVLELTLSLSLRLRKMNVQTPMEVTISVYQGHQTEGFLNQVPLAGVLVERWYMAPGVRRIPITEDGLSATLFLPPGRTTGESEWKCPVVEWRQGNRNSWVYDSTKGK